MDRVRLGRALGYGTRHAAKTVAAVVEAATAEGSGARPAARGTGAPATGRRLPAERSQPPRSRAAAQRVDVGNGLRQMKRSFWQPLAVFSGALWLRVTGLFFALIALTMGAGAWRLHPGLHSGIAFPGPRRFWVFAAFAALFGYFAVSSFVRASLKERRAIAAAR